jgi:hypothetical protein
LKTQIKQLLYGILATSFFSLSCTSLTWAAEEFEWPPKDDEPIVTLLGPVYETGRETRAPLFKALEQAMTEIVENQQTHLPEFYQKRITGMNHQLFRPGYSNEEEWGSIKSLSSKAEDYDPESMAGILESSEYRKPGLEMGIRMQPTIDPQPASVTLEGYRFVLQPSGKGQAEWFTQEVKLKGRNPDDAFRNALIWELVKPFEKIQKTFVLDDLDVPVWKDKITAGVLTFAKKEFTADAEPVRKETVEVCVQTRLCPEMNVKGDEFVLVSKITDAQTICRIFGRELIDKETLLRLSLTEEGSNLLDEENGVAWHSGLQAWIQKKEEAMKVQMAHPVLGLEEEAIKVEMAHPALGMQKEEEPILIPMVFLRESGFFEENYNHHDFILGKSQSGVVWCRSSVQDTFNFQERPYNFVMDRGWRTIKLYKSNGVGLRILDEELVVEFLENDELYSPVMHGRILDNTFSDEASQGESVSVRTPQSRFVFGISFERYPIDVIFSGSGWERSIETPVWRLGGTGMVTEIRKLWNLENVNMQFGLGFSIPRLSLAYLDDKSSTTINGEIGGHFLAGLWGYLKLLPNIKWQGNLGLEKFGLSSSAADTVDLFFLNADVRLHYQWQKLELSVGMLGHTGARGTFEQGCIQSTTTSKTTLSGGGCDLNSSLVDSVSIPTGVTTLLGIQYDFF